MINKFQSNDLITSHLGIFRSFRRQKPVAFLKDTTELNVRKRRVMGKETSFPGIESRPTICGGEPCIAGTRIPVWALEQFRRQGVSEDEMLDCYPTLRAEDLANAWAYVRSHHEEIDRQIRENEEA
jgi:uncharacterized protein (DUF433 family)